MKTLLLTALLLAIFAGASLAQTPTPDPLTAEKQRADRLQSRLNDFAQLGRYAKANTELKAPAKGENRVVFLGDSITDGWKLNEYFPEKPYINRGISGQTTPQMLIRMRPDVIAHKPAVMVLLAGTNDIAGNTGPMTNEMIEDNIRSIVDLARANGIKVVLSSILPVSDYNKNRAGQPIVRTVQRAPSRILELNRWIKAYCAERGLVYLDYFSATVDDRGFLKEGLANDGLHPNAEGYKIMAPLAEAAIRQALKRK